MEWTEVVDVINGKTEDFENCIYMWRNKVNGKLYVGQAKDFKERTKTHKRASFNENQKYDYNIPLHCAIRKYGIENFEICILEYNLSGYDEMNEKEIYYIEKFDTLANNKKGYNVASGGGNANPLAGKTEEEMREISKKKSESLKGEKAYQCRKVICITNGEIFDYVKQAEEKYGVDHSHISACCCGKYKSAGIVDGKPAIWLYLEDYKKLSKEEIAKFKNKEVPNGRRPKAVICITTGKIYEGTHEASRQTKVVQQNIAANCRAKCKSAGKDENGNKLIWMYLEDYQKLTQEEIDEIKISNRKKS